MFFQLQQSLVAIIMVHRSKLKIKLKIATIREDNCKWEIFCGLCRFFLLSLRHSRKYTNRQIIIVVIIEWLVRWTIQFVSNGLSASVWCTTIWISVTIMECRTEQSTWNTKKRNIFGRIWYLMKFIKQFFALLASFHLEYGMIECNVCHLLWYFPLHLLVLYCTVRVSNSQCWKLE